MAFMALAEIKAHLRVDSATDDVQIMSIAAAAYTYIERLTGLVLAPRAATFLFDRFGHGLQLPLRPVALNSIAITYLDSAGASQSYSTIRVIERAGFTKIFPAIGSAWPVHACGEGVITVSAEVGSDTGPDDVRQAAKLLIGHWYENREAAVSGVMSNLVALAVDELLAAHRTNNFH